MSFGHFLASILTAQIVSLMILMKIGRIHCLMISRFVCQKTIKIIWVVQLSGLFLFWLAFCLVLAISGLLN